MCGQPVTLEDMYNLDAEINEAEMFMTADEWKWHAKEIPDYFKDVYWEEYR